MTTSSSRSVYLLSLIAAAGLSACGGSSDAVPPPDAEQQFGRISLGVSDRPVHDATKVCIKFDEIELKGEGPAETITLDPAQSVNLLDFQGMNAAPLLLDHEVPAGQYEWMRLGVDAVRGSNGGLGDTGGAECDGEASYIVMKDGTVHNLYVPSGENSGLKLHGGFTVPVNDIANFTAEIDLMKSLTAPPGQAPDVKLRPTIRLVNNVEAGTLTGQVAPALVAPEACDASVFVFADGVTPNPIDDLEEDPNDPVATAMVNERMNGNEVEYHYTVGFLLEGDYEVAFTCDGENFEPENGIGAFVEAGKVTTVDIPAPLAP